MTGEQLLESLMTNIVVRGIEIFGAPIFIWFKSRKTKKDWPRPILLGFVLVVLASCIFLEERITGWARTLSYGDEQIIREWLDEQKLPNTLSSTKEESFVFNVTGGFNFQISKKIDRPGIVNIRTNLLINPDIVGRLEKVSAEQRRQLWNEMRMELSRHAIYLPPGGGNDFKDLSVIGMQRSFAFPSGNAKTVLYQQLSDMKGLKYVVDLIYETWKSQGRI